jgi:hypothetical protein
MMAEYCFGEGQRRLWLVQMPIIEHVCRVLNMHHRTKIVHHAFATQAGGLSKEFP